MHMVFIGVNQPYLGGSDPLFDAKFSQFSSFSWHLNSAILALNLLAGPFSSNFLKRPLDLDPPFDQDWLTTQGQRVSQIPISATLICPSCGHAGLCRQTMRFCALETLTTLLPW